MKLRITLRVDKSKIERLKEMARGQRTSYSEIIRKKIDEVINNGKVSHN